MNGRFFSSILRALANIDYHEISFLSPEQWGKFRDDPWRQFLRFDDDTQDRIAKVAVQKHMSGDDEDDDGVSIASMTRVGLDADGNVVLSVIDEDGDALVEVVLGEDAARELADDLREHSVNSFPAPAGTA